MPVAPVTPPLASELFCIARNERERMLSSKPWAEKFSLSSVATQLCSAARQRVGSATLSDSDVLAIYFTDGALTRLSAMPNRYWFWSVVVEALCAAGDDNVKLDETCVKRGLGRMHPTAGNYDQRTPIGELSAHEACLQTAAGLLLFDPRLGQAVRNPIYC